MQDVSHKHLVLIKVEAGAWEPDQDEFIPKPMHHGGKGGIN